MLVFGWDVQKIIRQYANTKLLASQLSTCVWSFSSCSCRDFLPWTCLLWFVVLSPIDSSPSFLCLGCHFATSSSVSTHSITEWYPYAKVPARLATYVIAVQLIVMQKFLSLVLHAKPCSRALMQNACSFIVCSWEISCVFAGVFLENCLARRPHSVVFGYAPVTSHASILMTCHQRVQESSLYRPVTGRRKSMHLCLCE